MFLFFRIPAPVFLLSPESILFPRWLFIERLDLSQLLSGSCHAVCLCVCERERESECVCYAARLHKLLYRPSGTLLSRLLLSPLIFPILSHWPTQATPTLPPPPLSLTCMLSQHTSMTGLLARSQLDAVSFTGVQRKPLTINHSYSLANNSTQQHSYLITPRQRVDYRRPGLICLFSSPDKSQCTNPCISD